MKIRHGFVSNSSSSSFIVIGNGSRDKSTMPVIGDTLLVGVTGRTEFGWDVCTYSNMPDRINFAYLQTQDACDKIEGAKWLTMLDDALKRKFGVSAVEYMICEWCCGPKASEFGEYNEGYIDHASSACGGKNTEMFDSVDTLERFLFCCDSYIRGDNDNH